MSIYNEKDGGTILRWRFEDLKKKKRGWKGYQEINHLDYFGCINAIEIEFRWLIKASIRFKSLYIGAFAISLIVESKLN